jgi:ABC transporter substrate binding protein
LLLPLCCAVEAQQPSKVHRIGYLERTTASGSAVLVGTFRQELSKLGWIEGKNITIEYRFAEQKIERLSELAAELVRLKADVIVTGGFGPTRSAKEATATISIVMAQDPDPVGNGLVVSLARPGGNITGLSALSNELGTKRLEILKDAVPRLSRVAYLRAGDDNVQNRLALKETRAAARSLRIDLEEIETQFDAKGLENAFQTAKQKQVGAIMASSARPFFAERKRIVELAGPGCRLFTPRRSLSITVASCLTGQIMLTSIGAQPFTWIRFSKARSLPICRSSNRLNLNS